MPSTQVILFGNQKGGVGKTTTCVHVAAALGAAGRRCLVWDLDANQGATMHLGVDGEAYAGSVEVLSGEEEARDVIIGEEDAQGLPPGVDLIAASHELALIGAPRDGALPTLPLGGLLGLYDYILLDTAPSLTVPTAAGYRAADWFVLTAFADPFAIAGLARSIQTLQTARTAGTTGGRLLGVAFGCVAGSRSHQPRLEAELLDYADQRLNLDRERPLVFRSTITRSAVVPRAQMEGRTLFQTQPNHKVTRQYRALAKEIEQGITALDPAPDP